MDTQMKTEKTKVNQTFTANKYLIEVNNNNKK